MCRLQQTNTREMWNDTRRKTSYHQTISHISENGMKINLIFNIIDPAALVHPLPSPLTIHIPPNHCTVSFFSGLCIKLRCMWLDVLFVNSITDYLTNRPQYRKLGSVEQPRGPPPPRNCPLSPFLFTMYTSASRYNSKSCQLQMFPDDSATVGCINGQWDAEYKGLANNFAHWNKVTDAESLKGLSEANSLSVYEHSHNTPHYLFNWWHVANQSCMNCASGRFGFICKKPWCKKKNRSLVGGDYLHEWSSSKRKKVSIWWEISHECYVDATEMTRSCSKWAVRTQRCEL